MSSPSHPAVVSRTFGDPRFHTDAEIAAVAFAADGTAWSVDEAGLLRHWTADGQCLGRAFLSDLETLWVFSGDASLLASGNDDLLLWNTAEGQLLARIPQPNWVTAVAFSPDGRTVASGHDDGSVRFWDVRTQRLVGDIPAHPKAVSALAYTPDGERLATAGEDRIVRVWDAVTHKPLSELVSHTDRIPALVWSSDGTILVSAGWDTSARVWKPAESTDPLMLLNSHADQVVVAAFSPTGKLLATADSDYEIRIWADPLTAKARCVLRGHADDVRSLAFNADGTRLLSAGADRVVHLWDTVDGRLLAGPNPSGKHALAFIAGPTPLLASGCGKLRVWATATGDEVPPSGETPATAVAASPDGRYLAVGSTADHVVRLYDLAHPSDQPRHLESTRPPVGSLAFSPDGRLLAQTSPADGLVWLWNPTTDRADPELIVVEAADGCTLETVAIHPDSRLLAVGGVDVLSTGERDGAVCVWDRATKEKLMTFDVGVYAVAFDPQGKYLAGAGLTDRVHVWDLTSEQEVFVLEGHQQRINDVAFSPDGSYLLSGGDDATVRVWDMLTGRLMVMRELDSPVQSLAFSPDGKTLYTGNANTTCHQIEFAKLLEE
ncbi:MAG: WD40 repeat domain-containing protein [Fimbriiglobus sp.]|nr:WD40 repeat domain-containing protein [Fimbriiglobus sp.]